MIYIAITSHGYEDFEIRFVSQERTKTEEFIKERYFASGERLNMLSLDEDTSIHQYNFNGGEWVTDLCSILDVVNHSLDEDQWDDIRVDDSDVTLELSDDTVGLNVLNHINLYLGGKQIEINGTEVVFYNVDRYKEDA